MTTLKASFRHNSNDRFAIYSSSTIVLLISPGQNYHEGEKFAATIDLINRSNFAHCLIVVSDSNYRHTLSITDDSSPDELYLKAKGIGDEWLARNLSIINTLKISFDVTRWDQWFNHPTYLKHRATLDAHYINDKDFHSAFVKSATEYIERVKNRYQVNNYEKAMEASLEYLKEECTIIMPLWAEMGLNIIVYPSNMLDAMVKTYEAMVKPQFGDNLIWLTLRFKRKSELVYEDAIAV